MPEPEKRFTVYINCEGPEFQGRGYTSAILDILQTVTGNVRTGRFSGPITDAAGKTIGNWLTQWRTDDPTDRTPRRGRGRNS
jgi:hypothetical protein